MARPDTTGYGPGGENSEVLKTVSYSLKPHRNPMYDGVFARVKASDGRILGLLQFESEKEMEWMEKALSNDRRRTEEEIRRLEENS